MLRLEPVRVASSYGLVAVLVRLSAMHSVLAGRWFAETLFGCPRVAASNAPTFPDLSRAVGWLAGRLEPAHVPAPPPATEHHPLH